MIIAIIILSIGFTGSVIFNILLYLSKNSYVRQIKKIQEDNKKLKLDNEELRDLVHRKENEIKACEEALRCVESQKKEPDSLQTEQLKKQVVVTGDVITTVAKQKELEKENKRLTLRVAELEKTISVSSKSNSRGKQFEATIEEQKIKINSLEGQLNKKEEEKTNANQRCKNAEKRLTEIQCTFEQLRYQNDSYQTQLISAQKQIADLRTSKAELEKKNGQLLEQIRNNDNSDETILNQLSQPKRENKELQSNCSNYRIQIAKKEEKIPDKSGISNILNKLDFPIDSDVIQFKDGKFCDTLKRISDVSTMTEYLKKSSHEKAQRYLKQIKVFSEEMEELENTITYLNIDEDEMSSECIRKFSRVFNDYMAENVIEPVYKAKGEEQFYLDFFKLIIEYISKCGIYTKNVTVGSKYEKINYMDVIAEDTTDVSKHKMISKILKLPFYAKYTSETGEIKEKLLSKGCCVVLKAK